MKWGTVMETALVVSIVGVAIVGGVGFYMYDKTRKKNIDVFMPKLPNISKLEPIIKKYEQNCLHYYVFAWGNRKRISVEVESQLKAKYPLVLALPMLELSEYFPSQKEEQRKTVLAYLQQHNISVDDWTPETNVLKKYIQQKAEQTAEKIVDAMISQQTPTN